MLISHWDRIIKNIEAGAKAGLARAADKMKSEIVGEMYKTKTGRVYGGHQASAPGQSPASDTKAFEESVEIETEGDLRTSIYPTVPYAMVLEFGGARIAPRPMWLPVGMRLGGNEGQVVRIIAGEISKLLR